jgi:hypothetical protein
MAVPRIASPIPARVHEVVNEELITCVVRGRIFEVTVVGTNLSPQVGDKVIIELMPASKQWLLLVIDEET